MSIGSQRRPLTEKDRGVLVENRLLFIYNGMPRQTSKCYERRIFQSKRRIKFKAQPIHSNHITHKLQ